MIKSIWVDNFKSLVNFEIELAKFNCVVGLNGAGKSTLLQALDFVSQLMVGDIDEWLDRRQWDVSDLNSRLIKKRNIDFTIRMDINGDLIEWTGSFNRSSMICTREEVIENGQRILLVEDGAYTTENRKQEITFKYQGSLLSGLLENQLGPKLKAVKDQILNIRSLDLISPELLRSRARSSAGKLGLGGENLSALIHESGSDAKTKLKQKLFEVYPQLDSVTTKSLRSGWKQLEVHEHFGDNKLTSTARHTNDGMLRMMAILLQLDIGEAFLLFDEIENGINPELIEFLVDHLVESNDQVLVTTHSPMILNFMEDDVAREGVHYLYKTRAGYTRSIRLFDIPSLSEKLKFMGPGEAFIDTDLSELYLEIEGMNSQEA